MTKDARLSLCNAIIQQLGDHMMPLAVDGHVITHQYVYAGCSQWSSWGREWDDARHAMAWIVDGEYQLSFPDLDYFDGREYVDRQTKYYLQGDNSESAPALPIGSPLRPVPDSVLLGIAAGLAAIRLVTAPQPK